MNTIGNSLTQLQAEFEAHLTTIAKQHRQALLFAFVDQLQQTRAARHTPPKLYPSLLVQAGAWVKQHLLRQNGQAFPTYEDKTWHLTDEDAVTIVDSEYHVVGTDSVQPLNLEQEEIVL